MPRDGSGVYSYPPNGNAVTATPIDSSKYNARMADLLADLNAARPIPAGGTNAVTPVGAADNLSTASNAIASATTTDLSTATGTSVTITGTATITGFGTLPAGVLRHLTFAGAATLTHNATSLILPGAANIVTAAGDTATAQSLGTGNWRVRSFQRAAQAPYSPATPLVDANLVIADDGDPTKKFQFQASGITTGQTRIFTVPDLTGTMALRTTLYGTGFRNLKVQAISATQAQVTADVLFLEDTNGFLTRLTNVNFTADISTAGAGGLDTGVEAANAWYYLYAIWDGTNTKGLFSASATTPTMPGVYTHKARLAVLRNDASANLWRTLQFGRRAHIQIGTNPTTVPVLASGTSGSPTAPTWTPLAIGSFVPPTAASIRGTMSMAQSDSTRAILAPNNSYGAWNSANAAPVGNGNNGITGSFIIINEQFDLLLESTNIYYASSNGSTVVLPNGWDDNL
ncbi:hypothetical protein FJ930_19785 [Mesorhizobium sp. B2-4-15]|uniref:hypothetical protein n=1 Tax=Mesorhizobium sp. B2-4-15 TaxID=2589934 RepID=UPI00114EE479|nr:hypothetical protein [Mesorhizobium sp. B2-4-15]TPK70210.1 hypothetical protein FJ930_19785 [Mesorhizobium sp. B2-4-15]